MHRLSSWCTMQWKHGFCKNSWIKMGASRRSSSNSIMSRWVYIGQVTVQAVSALYDPLRASSAVKLFCSLCLRLFRDESQPITDDCIKCPPGKYQEAMSIHNSLETSKSFWSPTASNASYLCEDCPGPSNDSWNDSIRKILLTFG